MSAAVALMAACYLAGAPYAKAAGPDATPPAGETAVPAATPGSIPTPDVSSADPSTAPASAAGVSDSDATPLIQDVGPERTPRTFVALGDSLTAWVFAPGSHTPSTSGTWPALLAGLTDHLTLVHNAGVPGNLTGQMLARLRRDVFAYSPDTLLVMGGTNDIGAYVPVATIVGNLREIVDQSKARGIRVVLLTIPPSNSLYAWQRRQMLQANAAIKKLAADEHVRCIDVFTVLANRDGRLQTPFAARDRLHLTDRGEAELAQTVYRALYPPGPERPPAP